MPWARASALDRAMECSATSWFPRADRGRWQPGYLVVSQTQGFNLGPPPADDAVLAQWGTEMHLAKEDPERSADPWRSLMEPHRERLWPASLGKHEAAWSYDCRDGRIDLWLPNEASPPDKEEWKASRGPSCVTGTTDWWGHLPAGEPWVDDLKTGWQTPALTTPQMLMYALVAARAARSMTCRISITHWRRDWDTPDRRWQQVGPSTLDTFADELNQAWQRAAAGPLPRPGSHCRYCPSATVCPAVIGPEKEPA